MSNYIQSSVVRPVNNLPSYQSKQSPQSEHEPKAPGQVHMVAEPRYTTQVAPSGNVKSVRLVREEGEFMNKFKEAVNIIKGGLDTLLDMAEELCDDTRELKEDARELKEDVKELKSHA